MSVQMCNKLLLIIGFISLTHTAYSAAQHRSFLRITEQDSSVVPIDILFQAIVSLSLIIYGTLQVVGDFKEIRAAVDLQAKSWETLSNIPSFYSFNHRGRALSPNYRIKESTLALSANDDYEDEDNYSSDSIDEEGAQLVETQ